MLVVQELRGEFVPDIVKTTLHTVGENAAIALALVQEGVDTNLAIVLELVQGEVGTSPIIVLELVQEEVSTNPLVPATSLVPTVVAGAGLQPDSLATMIVPRCQPGAEPRPELQTANVPAAVMPTRLQPSTPEAKQAAGVVDPEAGLLPQLSPKLPPGLQHSTLTTASLTAPISLATVASPISNPEAAPELPPTLALGTTPATTTPRLSPRSLPAAPLAARASASALPASPMLTAWTLSIQERPTPTTRSRPQRRPRAEHPQAEPAVLFLLVPSLTLTAETLSTQARLTCTAQMRCRVQLHLLLTTRRLLVAPTLLRLLPTVHRLANANQMALLTTHQPLATSQMLLLTTHQPPATNYKRQPPVPPATTSQFPSQAAPQHVTLLLPPTALKPADLSLLLTAALLLEEAVGSLAGTTMDLLRLGMARRASLSTCRRVCPGSR